MPIRSNTVPRTTTPVPLDPTPLQLCLAAAVKDDERAMKCLPRRGRATYITVRLNQLAALELEQGQSLAQTSAGALTSGRWA
jgi:hypothetical protein